MCSLVSFLPHHSLSASSEPRHAAGPPSLSNAGACTYAGDVEKARRSGVAMADEREASLVAVRMD